MKRISITLLFCITIFSGFSQAETKSVHIRKLLEITGAAKTGVQMAQSMIGSFKKNYPNVTDDFWDDFSKELNADTLTEMIIPIYEKHYTINEIKQLIEFYETPLGKKLISTMPEVMQESMQAGQVWGKAVGEKVYQNLKEKGFLKKEE